MIKTNDYEFEVKMLYVEINLYLDVNTMSAAVI